MVTRTARAVSPSMTLWLTAVWLLLFRDFTLLYILSGVGVALAIQVLFPLPRVRLKRAFRPLSALRLAARFLWDMLVAAVQVSWLILRRRPPQPIYVAVELYSSSELYLTIVSNMTCLVPGSIVVRAQLAPSRLTLHVLDGPLAGGPEGVARTVHATEMRVLKALASREEIAAARAKRAQDPTLQEAAQ